MPWRCSVRTSLRARNCDPRSVWTTHPATFPRLATALPTASTARRAFHPVADRVAHDPVREHVLDRAQIELAFTGLCSVMSVSQSRFAASAVNSRRTRSSWTGGPGRRPFPRLRLPNADHQPLSRQTRHAVRSATSLATKVGRTLEHVLTSLRRAAPLIDKLATAAGKVAGHIAEWLKGFRPGSKAPTANAAPTVRPRASVGEAPRKDYRKTFLEANPDINPKEVVVHHAIEQQVLRYYKGSVTESQMHSLENLRGIPQSLNNTLHLRDIRDAWDDFYLSHPTATLDELLDYATEHDDKFGHLFTPPIR